jgi:hypothetical protein
VKTGGITDNFLIEIELEYYNGSMKIRCIFLILFIPQVLASQTAYKFSFGPAKEVPQHIKVNPSDIYSAEKGYGFDFGTSPSAIDREGKKALTSGFCTSEGKPFFFSVRLMPGNYDIKIITGDLKEPSMTTVRAESRRLIFEKVQTKAGEFRTLTASINVRTPKIGNAGEEVKRKPREINKLNWDEKLTFEFTDIRPCICALEITRNDNAATIFLAGNSTVVDQDDDPWLHGGRYSRYSSGRERRSQTRPNPDFLSEASFLRTGLSR